MDEHEFVRRMNQARVMGGDYAAGYQRGLRRLYHGEGFGAPEEHRQWMALGRAGDTREDLGRGYRDGFTGRAPKRDTFEGDAVHSIAH